LKKVMVMVLVVGMLLVASVASAQMGPIFGKGKVQLTVGLTQFTAHTADTLAFGSGSSPAISDNGLLGFGADVRYGLSNHWAAAVGGFFGFGSDKIEASASGDAKISYSAFGIRLGLDHTTNLNDETGIYWGPGFEFASAKSKVQFGTSEDDNDRATSLSLHSRLGVIHRMGDHFTLSGGLGNKWSYVKSSYDRTAPVEKVTASRWVSSPTGTASIVFMF